MFKATETDERMMRAKRDRDLPFPKRAVLRLRVGRFSSNSYSLYTRRCFSSVETFISPN